jgi:hypothetical protein
MRSRRILLPAIVLAAVAVGFQMAPQKAPFNDSISKDAMRSELFFLAGDGFKGRLTDTPENLLATEYVKARFERMGLKPANNGSFFHNYNLVTTTLGSDNSLQVIRGDNDRMQLRSGQDYYPQSFSGNAHVRGAVVFAGFGITAPQFKYDDYKGPDIRGKIVLVIDHEPGENDPASPFDGVVTSDASGGFRKALAAQQKGAIGILFVSDVHNHPQPANFEAAARNAWPAEPPRLQRYTLQTWIDQVHIPAAQISPALAATLIGTNRSLLDLAKASETATGITPVPLTGAQVELVTSVNRHVVPDRSIVGMIEGSDPLMKNEYIIISAHIDHDGVSPGGIMNGADDNGSGSIGLINIAEAYAQAAKAGQRPKRTIIFADWNSEERGLLGAWAYTEAPLFPLDKTVAVLNMDMIGRNEEVPEGGGARFRGLALQTAESNNNATNVIGTTRSTDMRTAVEKANGGIGLDLRFRYDNNVSNLMRRSDHWPFLQRGIPAIWFHTGLHPDYHTPNDRPEKINYVKMEKVARLVHQMSWDLAQQEDKPKMSPGVKTLY